MVIRSQFDKGSLRRIATPLVSISFIVVAVTGLLFEFVPGTKWLMPAHKWIGYLMIVGVAVHLVPNWRPFVRVFFSRYTIGIGIMVALGAGALTLYTKHGEHPHRCRRHHTAASQFESTVRASCQGSQPSVKDSTKESLTL